MVHTTLNLQCMGGSVHTLTSNINQVHSASHHTGEHSLHCRSVEIHGGKDGPTCQNTPINIVYCDGLEVHLCRLNVDSAVCGILAEAERLGDVVSNVIQSAPNCGVECVVHWICVDGIRVGGVDRHISYAGEISVGCESDHSLLAIHPDNSNRWACICVRMCGCDPCEQVICVRVCVYK